MKENNYIECPICRGKFKSLVRHVPYKHNISMDEFRKKYPGHPVQLGVLKEDSIRSKKEKVKKFYEKFWDESSKKYKCPHCGKLISNISGLQAHCLSHGDKLKAYKEEDRKDKKESNYICKYCGEHFKDKRGLGIHLSIKHKEEWNNLKKKKEFKEGFECPICHKIYVGLGDHIRASHNMDWETFKNTYNWVLGKSYFSKEHKENLSKNKKKFYKTKRGVELRQLQSNQEGPYSKKAFEDFFKNETPNTIINSRSYFFWKDNKLYCRSFEEYYVRYILDKNNIKYEYENLSIRYVEDGIERNYNPDIIINNNLYEIKSEEYEFYNDDKYKWILKTLKSTPYKLKVITSKNIYNIIEDLNIIPTKTEVYEDIYNKFWNDDTFIIGGRFSYNELRNLNSPFLNKVFKKDYDKFKEENCKRKLNYENFKYKKD